MLPGFLEKYIEPSQHRFTRCDLRRKFKSVAAGAERRQAHRNLHAYARIYLYHTLHLQSTTLTCNTFLKGTTLLSYPADPRPHINDVHLEDLLLDHLQ